MLKFLKGIKIQGRKFTNATEFDFWGKETSRISLLYGRNGSGKSTISDAFEALKKDEVSDFTMIAPLLFPTKSFGEEDKKNIFVFNEKFVDRNIKIEDDGIGSIVMFGRQAELDNQIKEKKELLNQICSTIEQDTLLCGEFNDKKNNKSPAYYLRKCEDSLKTDKGWANQDSLLKGMRHNSAVNTSVVVDIAKNFVTSKSLNVLAAEFRDKKKLYDSVTPSSKKITEDIKTCSFLGIDSLVKTALTRKIEKNELTGREQKIFDFVQQKGLMLLNNAREFFKEQKNDFCPYCFQPMTASDKELLMKEFKNVLNKEVETYLDELQRMKMAPLSFAQEPFSQLDQSQVSSVVIALNNLNNEIKKLNQLIDKRIENVYQEFGEKDYSVNIDFAVSKFNDELKKLNEKKCEFNNLIDGKASLLGELVCLNKQIACKAIFDDYSKYLQQSIAKVAADKKKDDDEREKEKLEAEIRNLESQKKNVKIAQMHINKLLKYVYFDDNRMMIESENDIYRIKSCGQPVKPNKISCGERNILALCYYFTELFSQKDESKVYSNPYLLVIDDPISSYDKENQVGVISLLKYQLNNFMSGNAETKCLLMTHDLKTFYDLQRIADELGKKEHCDYDLNELLKSKLERFKFRSRNEYSEYLKKAYEYACGRNDTIGDYIGNLLRKIVEFYSTFLYRLGIEEISINKDVLDLLQKKEHREYFENLMYRLVLNGESHLEERARSMDDFCNGLSDDEKKRTARDILCFLYLMNPLHIKKHLDGCSDVETTLKQWCNRIG